MELPSWSFILAFLGMTTVFNSDSAGLLLGSCSALHVFAFSAASTFPVDGAGEEHAESAGCGDVLSLLLVLSSSSSSSLDKMIGSFKSDTLVFRSFGFVILGIFPPGKMTFPFVCM